MAKAKSNTGTAAQPAAATTAEQQGNLPAEPVQTADPAPSAVAPAAGADTRDMGDGEVEGLWVTANAEHGMRRCGFRFTREGLGIALSALTGEQIEQLEAEPGLTVVRGSFSGLVG